jgi:5-methyltetrahydrofolate--homocysteine methyltransferase
VVHVLDASRAVGVASRLLNPELRGPFLEELAGDYSRLRTQHGQRKSAALLPIVVARRRATPIDWTLARPPKPSFTGVHVLATDGFPLDASDASSLPSSPLSLAELVPFIDWSPFFHTWELRGRYPDLLSNPEAKKLHDDALKLLDEIVERRLLAGR